MPRKPQAIPAAGLWVALAASLLTAPLPGEETRSTPFLGVTMSVRHETSPRPLVMHLVWVDLQAPGIRFKVTPPGPSRDTVRQTTLAFLAQEQAQVAVNAHFYVPFPSTDAYANLVGLAVSDGVLYSPFEGQPVADGYQNQDYAIVACAPALNIDPWNHAGIVHVDTAQADNRHILEPVTLWNALAGSAQIITHGAKTLPDYSGPPEGLNPTLVYSDANSWYGYLRARTVIGLTRDPSTLLLFTVDEAGGSLGMSVGEVADLLIRDYGVEEALNLDGDGSTSLAIADPVSHLARLVNVPSDGLTGRAVGSSLAVFALPAVALRVSPLAAGDGVVLSWPAALPGWRPEESSSPSGAEWTPLTSPPLRVDDGWELPVRGSSGVRFYRLRLDGAAPK